MTREDAKKDFNELIDPRMRGNAKELACAISAYTGLIVGKNLAKDIYPFLHEHTDREPTIEEKQQELQRYSSDLVNYINHLEGLLELEPFEF